MQIVIDSLERPWGLELQFSIVARWLKDEISNFQIVTRSLSESFYPELKDHTTITHSPHREIDPESPTLGGPYPATKWIQRANVKNYSICLSHIPWGLYPTKQEKWIGGLPAYLSDHWKLLGKSIGRLFSYPYNKIKRSWVRGYDQAAIAEAENLYIYDERLDEPVHDVYDRDPKLAVPTALVGRGKSTEPENFLLAIGPFDSPQNAKLIIESFYLFINRLGTQRNRDWESAHPLRMWESGSFELRLYGRGEGQEYLQNYAESQQLHDQVKFMDWPDPTELDELISKALAVVDLPRTATASNLPYHAIAMGVPAVYSSRHKGLDSLVDDNPLSTPVGCNDENQIAKALLKASRVPKSKRQPVEVMRDAMDPESIANSYRKDLSDNLH